MAQGRTTQHMAKSSIALDYWSHYLRPKQFVVHSDHEALKFLNGQLKLNPRHTKWDEFLQSFSFLAKHKKGSTNIGLFQATLPTGHDGSKDPRIPIHP